jgi:hypothetical protein
MGGLPADIDVSLATLVGPAGRVLVCYADRDEDLLVVGHSRRGRLRRLGRGSVRVTAACVARRRSRGCCPAWDAAGNDRADVCGHPCTVATA